MRKIVIGSGEDIDFDAEEIQLENEISMQGSMDKLTVQVAFVFVAYFIAYILMYLLGMLLPATWAPQKPMLTFVILVIFFGMMNLILFRQQIFKVNQK